jgi:Ca2+-binding RTX toxin-like protein
VVIAGGQHFRNLQQQGIVLDSHIYDPATNEWTNTSPTNDPHGTPGGNENSEPMVILSASPTSYVADPAVCGRHCGKAMIAGNSVTPSTELFTAAGTCFGFDATITGTDSADALTGGPGRDVILGLGGADRINALDGDDIICGGEGNDAIQAGTGNDVILAGGGIDRLNGFEGNDFLFGEADADRVQGDAGNDTADGGDASDACAAETRRRCP